MTRRAPEKLNDLVEFLSTIGVKFAEGDRVRPAQFNGVLSRVGQAAEALVNEVVLACAGASRV